MVGNKEQLRKGIWGVSGGRKLDAKFDLISYHLVFQTGIFSYDYCIWNSHPASYNTWSQFKLDSTHDHPEYCKSQVNNPVVSVFHYGQVTPLHNEHQQGIIDAITNLLTDTAADRTSIYALTTTNTIILKYLDNSNKKLVAVFTNSRVS